MVKITTYSFLELPPTPSFAVRTVLTEVVVTNDLYDRGVNVVLLQGITLNYMYSTD